MKIKDIFIFSSYSVISQKMRSFLTSLGIAVGVVCVIFLTQLRSGPASFYYFSVLTIW